MEDTAETGLLKKVWKIWAEQYHFVIPLPILKDYVRKYETERNHILKYGQRFFDPVDPEQYQKWLSFQNYESGKPFSDITFVGKNLPDVDYTSLSMDVLNTDLIHTGYTCICEESVHLHDVFWNYLHECTKADITYFDHDQRKDGMRCNPQMKPDFAYDTLRGFNYIGNCWIIRTELLKQFNGQKWNPYRWLLELSDQKLKWNHISKVLYADNAEDKNDLETVREYLKDHDIQAEVLPKEECQIVRYALKDHPLVSIVIPTKDGLDVLKTCIDSIWARTTYDNFEIVIADNGSSKKETLQYFADQMQEHDNFRVFDCSGPFNFSAINNRAVKALKSDYVILLNNDTAVITPDWIEEMLRYAQRENVGTVGALLYYGDDTIQHGGVISGKGGGFAHKYYRKPKDQKDYMHDLTIPYDVSGCTAACLMISRKKFNEIGGMNEDLTVQYNDADLCLRMHEKGWNNVFLPYVKLYHYESKSRGIDKNRKAVQRFVSEVQYVQKRWAPYIVHDPFYNDQFDKSYDYMLKAGEDQSR